MTTALTPAQHMRALEVANENRLAQADYKRELRSLTAEQARSRAAEVILEPPKQLAKMRVSAALLAIPKMGEHRVTRLLRDVHIFSPGWSLSRLTDRQRVVIVTELRK